MIAIRFTEKERGEIGGTRARWELMDGWVSRWKGKDENLQPTGL